MSSLIAFLKKEYLESVRSGKFLLLGLLFVLFGIMNPAIAKLTPWLLEVMSDSLAETGMTVTAVEVDALTSWTQFFKNIPMALIVFVLIYSSIFTKEYASGTLVLLLTKGLARYKVVLAKAIWMLTFWTLGYFVCFGITYGYNAYFWDNAVAVDLLPAVMHWYLFSLLVICLMVLFSVLSRGYTGVLLGTGGTILAFYLASLFPVLREYMPTSLMNSAALLVGAETANTYLYAIIITGILCIASLAISIPIMKKKQL